MQPSAALPQHNLLAHLETQFEFARIPLGVVGQCARAYASPISKVISLLFPLPLSTEIVFKARTWLNGASRATSPPRRYYRNQAIQIIAT